MAHKRSILQMLRSLMSITTFGCLRLLRKFPVGALQCIADCGEPSCREHSAPSGASSRRIPDRPTSADGVVPINRSVVNAPEVTSRIDVSDTARSGFARAALRFEE